MLNQVYRLVSARQFEVQIVNEKIDDKTLIIRPTHLSICVADQRYFTGQRDKKVLNKKLPMALIHEGIGEVIYDPKDEFSPGQRVIMVPNTPIEEDQVIKENYLPSSKFRSSGYDGFTQDYVFLQRDRAIMIPDEVESDVAAYTELFSVAMHAISRMEVKKNKNSARYGVWGDGNLGYLTSLILKYMYPESEIIVFGKNSHKLAYFSFIDQVINIEDIPDDLVLDHVFECVGGRGSQSAIQQAIHYIKPEGTISLLGVSEYPVEIETRVVLEKGLTLFGSSRSGREDFQRSVDFIVEHKEVQAYLKNLIGQVVQVEKLSDIVQSFEIDLANAWGKTIMEWKV